MSTARSRDPDTLENNGRRGKAKYLTAKVVSRHESATAHALSLPSVTEESSEYSRKLKKSARRLSRHSIAANDGVTSWCRASFNPILNCLFLRRDKGKQVSSAGLPSRDNCCCRPELAKRKTIAAADE